MTATLNRVRKKSAAPCADAESLLQRQIELVANKNEICPPPQKHDDSTVPLQDHILKAHAVLTFYPEPKVARRIKNLSSASGTKLVEETKLPDGRNRVAIWNEKTKSQDVYEEIYTERLGRGQYARFAAYYDVTNNCITINYGGTGFKNKGELQAALQTAAGLSDVRMTRVADCVGQTLSAFEKLYPGLKDAKVPVDIYAHSTGATAVALTNYFLRRKHGITPRAQVMFDPFGAQSSFEKVAALVAQAENRDSKSVLAELTRNTVSFKVKGGTFIDRLESTGTATVGQVMTVDVKGNKIAAHMGKAWIKHFNKAELKGL